MKREKKENIQESESENIEKIIDTPVSEDVLKQEETPQKSEAEVYRELLDEANDKYLRLAAEFDNYKKRTLKEKEVQTKYAAAETASKFLSSLDNLERAANAPTENIEAYANGVALVLKGMQDAFTAIGIKEIEGVGAVFDPELHNAVMSTEAEDDTKRDTVIEVFQKGYILGDRVIRHAMVKVAN